MAIKRREFLRLAGAASLAPAVFARSRRPRRARRAERPNILFIMSDDHAYQAISCYDGRLNTTPHIDRLAKGGVRFERSYCTNSICAPCRAVLLTGAYSHVNGVVDNAVRFDGSQITFPKLLREAGYQTALFGKWHLKTDPTGFDKMVDPARPGRLLQPRFHHRRRPLQAHGIRHGPHHGRGPGLASRPRQGAAVLRPASPQGAAPQLAARPQAYGPLQGRDQAPPVDLLRRLRHAERRRPQARDAHRGPHDDRTTI